MLTGRLAPSPTGRLHLGHARSFLLAWWSVRSRGGRILLRFEDLDTARVKPGAVDDCLRDLEWLGLDWDEAPLHQSQSVEAMRAATERLLDDDRAYPCTCSRRDILASLSAPHATGQEIPYPGTCRGRAIPRDATSAVRFVVPSGPVLVHDAFAGDFSADASKEVGDFLIARRDDVYAYQLAVIVDDARQGVTEIVRGDDLLSSAPRQHLLQQALGLPTPTWYHVPLVVDADGRRLSKREGDIALTDLRERGVSGSSIARWAAATAGMDTEVIRSASDALAAFSWSQVPREPVRLTQPALAEILHTRK